MAKHVFSWVAGACLFALPFYAHAGLVNYGVTVDTHTLAGTTGSVDFNFNPGLSTSQAASVEVFNLVGSSASGPSFTVGEVVGEIPMTLTFDNAAALNDYFQGLTFGQSLSFGLRFFGPALENPDGQSSSGSTFAFSLFSDAAGTLPVLTSNGLEGFALTVDVNTDGTTSVHNFSAQLSVLPTVTSVPEPGTLPLLTLAGVAVALRRRAMRDKVMA